jgi:hypothetical protein
LGNNSNSNISVSQYHYCFTGVPLPSNTLVALEVDAGAGTLHFFINNKQIPYRVTGVPSDVYFGVWYCICEYETIYIIIIKISTAIIIAMVCLPVFLPFSALFVCHLTKLWSFITLHTFIPLHTKWLEMWRTRMGKRVDYSNLRYLLKTVERLVWRIIFFNLREAADHLLINC